MEYFIENVTNPCQLFSSSVWETFSHDTTITVYAEQKAIHNSELFKCVIPKIMDKSAVILVDNEQDHPKWFFPDLFKSGLIFMFLGLENFFKLSLDLRNQALWNPRARIIIHANSEPEGLLYLDILWKTTWAVNATLMIIKQDVEFFTWIPYAENTCRFVQELVKTEAIFPIKFSRNLHQCPIRVITWPVEPYVMSPTKGIEPEVVLSIVKALNLSYVPVQLSGNLTPWHQSDESGRPIGVLKMLLEHEVDLALSHFLRTWLGSLVVDMPVAHSPAGMFWYAPYPSPVSRVNNMFKAFAPDVWIGFGVSLIGVMVVAFLDRSRVGVLDALGLVLNQPLTKPMSRLLAFFVVVVSWYSVHMSTAYQSSLIVFLSEIAREKPIETFQDLAESDLKFLYVVGTDVMYNQSQPELWEEILKPERVTYMPFTDLTKVTDGDHFTVASKSIVDYFLKADKFYDNYGFPLFRPLDEPFSSDYVVFYVSPGHPLLHEMDRVILWLLDAGLPKYWARRYAGKQRPKTLLVREPFGLVNLEGAFYILSAALVLSFIVFVGELVTHLLKK